jgi:hypothetical protein
VDSIGKRLHDKRAVIAVLLALWLAVEVLWGSWIALRPESLPLVMLAALGLAVAAAIMQQPIVGLYLFVAAMLTEASWMLGSVSAARLLGMLVLVAWVARGLARGRLAIVVPAQAWLAALFALWAFVSVLWAGDTASWVTAWLLLLQSAALYILVVNLVDSVQRLRAVLAIITVVNMALALLTLLQVVIGNVGAGRVDLGHISVGDPNTQAVFFLPSAVLWMVWFSQEPRRARKLVLLLGFSLMVMAILATGSRSALMGLALAVVLGALIDRRLWQVALPAVVLAGVGALLLPSAFTRRLRSLVTLADRGAGRVDIWLVVLRVIQAHPLLGVGLGSFPAAFDRYLSDTPGIVRSLGRRRVVHNIFFYAQTELGMLGLALFVAFTAWSLARGLAAVNKCRQANRPDMAALALAIFLSLAGMLVAGLFLNTQYWKLFWVLLALPEVMHHLSAQALQETTPG